MAFGSAAPPETASRTRPPSFSVSVENTRRSASRRCAPRTGPTDRPALSLAAASEPTRTAHAKTACCTAEPSRTCFVTAAWTFSNTRGTDTSSVGRTSGRFFATVSTDSA